MSKEAEDKTETNIVELRKITEQINNRLNHLEERIGRVENSVAELQGTVSQMDKRLSHIETELTELRGRMESLRERMESNFRWLVAIILGTILPMWITTMLALVTILSKLK